MSCLPEPRDLLAWIENSLSRQENVLATSNQGTILYYHDPFQPCELIVKSAMGRGVLRTVRQKTLEREYQAYQRLHGVAGVPECYGFLAGRYLLLEYIKGTPYRDTHWSNRDQWFDELLLILNAIHERGVSHGDLKSKSNLMSTIDEHPRVIDFGTAFINKPGFHPLNNWLFRTGKRLDLNAWVKHKNFGIYGNASEADQELLDYSWLERLVRKLSGRPMDRLDRKEESPPET